MSLPNGLHSLSDSSFPKSVSYEITRGNQLLRKTKRQRQRLVVPDRDPRRGSTQSQSFSKSPLFRFIEAFQSLLSKGVCFQRIALFLSYLLEPVLNTWTVMRGVDDQPPKRSVVLQNRPCFWNRLSVRIGRIVGVSCCAQIFHRTLSAE